MQVPPPWDQVHPRDQVQPPRTRYTPLGPGTPLPRTRYTPFVQVFPWTRCIPPDQVDPHPLGPSTPPMTRYTPHPRPVTPPWDQVHPPGQGTPPRSRYTNQPCTPPGPGTPPADSYCCGRHASGKQHEHLRNMSHFAYACKMRCPLNLVLENSEYLWFY